MEGLSVRAPEVGALEEQIPSVTPFGGLGIDLEAERIWRKSAISEGNG